MPVRGENSLFFATGLDNTGLKKGSVQAVSMIQGMASRISKINPFVGLAIAAVAAFAKISNEAYKLAKEYEHAMKEVETISKATQDNFDGVSKKVFELSEISPDGPVELAKAYYQIVSAGYDGAQGLKLLEAASKAAVGGVTDTKTAADGLTTILNAWKKSAEDVTNVSDVLFTTVKLGKTTFEELSNSISVVAPLAAATGISLEEVTGAVASLTKQGVPTTVAMTQIRQAIIALTENLGDGWTETFTFQEALGVLVQKANGSQNELKKLVGRIEGVNAVLALTGDNAKMAGEDLEAMSNATGAANDAFKTLAADVTNEWKILGNRIRGLTRGLGEAFLELSGSVAKFFNDALEDSDKLSKALEQERLDLLVLESKIKDVNTTNEERIRLINELKDKYPELLGNINAETISNEDLFKSLEKVNQQLINKIVLQRKEEEIKKFRDRAADDAEKALEREAVLRERLTQIADKNNLKLKEGLTLTQQAQDVLNRLPKGGTNEGLFGDRGQLRLAIKNAVFTETIAEGSAALSARLEKEKQELAVKLGLVIEKEEVEGVSEEVQKVIDEVKAITLNEFKANTKIFEPYLKSTEKAVREVAQARQKAFTFDPNKSGDDPLDTFLDGINKRKDQYRVYTLAIAQGEQELAQKLKAQYGLNEEDFRTYLRNLYNSTESSEFKAAILDIAEQAGGLNERKKITGIERPETQGVVTDIQVDTTSYEAVARRIANLQQQAQKAQSAAEQKALGEKIRIEQQKLDAIDSRINKSVDLEEDFYKIIQSLSRKGLVNKKRQLKAELKATEKNLGKASKEYEQLADQIKKVNEEIGKDLAGIADEFSNGFSELGSLFEKFGDEDTAQLLDQLSGVADGIGQIASGDVIGGTLAVLNSAITVEVESDTAKFEAAIKKLEKAIDDLDYVISKSIGDDKISGRIEGIDKLKELEQQTQNAIEAEKEARKKVKFLGITIGKKRKGSGTDPEKLEELAQKAEEARRKAQELREELDKIYTDTTQSTIVDSIISGLKEGKRTVEDFADNFQQLMQDAILNAFQLKYLEDEVEKFYEAFADAGEDQNFTAQEIAQLRAIYENMINGAQNDIDAINEILDSAGIGNLGATDPKGLSGAIKTIQEDTANVLAGTLNSIRIDVKQSLSVAQQSSEYLSQIAANTSYNRYLERLDAKIEITNTKLGDIETALS